MMGVDIYNLSNSYFVFSILLYVGTVMLLDETALSEGQLNETGISNIVAINSVLSRQQLAYDFQYQTIDFPTNVVCTVNSAF